jgi:hypothetical protein
MLVFVFALVYKLRNVKNGLPSFQAKIVAAQGGMK